MIKEKIMDMILEISEKFKGITQAHYEYYKAATYEQFVVVVSAITIISILFFLFGLFLVLLMSVRLVVEQFKIAQIDSREDWIFGLNTGQVLSIPFVLCGLYFMFLYKPKKA